jgi:CBS domain-containing protein
MSDQSTQETARMEFTVRDWMNNLIIYIDPHKTVTEALSLMRRRYISSLIVNKVTPESDYGILTSTDICDKIIAQNRNPSKMTVRQIMTSPLLTINENSDVQECAALMKKHQIHHIPVVNDKKELVGMISATDFLVVAEAMGRDPGERIV